MRKDNAFPVTFMMQPISLQMKSEKQKNNEAEGTSARIRSRNTVLFNSLELGRSKKQNYLKERLHDSH